MLSNSTQSIEYANRSCTCGAYLCDRAMLRNAELDRKRTVARLSTCDRYVTATDNRPTLDRNRLIGGYKRLATDYRGLACLPGQHVRYLHGDLYGGGNMQSDAINLADSTTMCNCGAV